MCQQQTTTRGGKLLSYLVTVSAVHYDCDLCVTGQDRLVLCEVAADRK